MPKKTIMVLGAGREQVDLIKTANRMGVRVIALDRDPRAPGFQYCDRAINEDIADSDRCLKTARKIKPDGVLTSTEQGLISAAIITDDLGLTGNTVEQVHIVKDKYRQLQLLAKAGVSYPPTVVIKRGDAHAKRFIFPGVIKPLDNAGARGVIFVRTPDKFDQALRWAFAHTRQEKVLFQTYLPGPEYGAEIVVQDGSIRGIYTTDKRKSRLPYFVVMGHTMPSTLSRHALAAFEKSMKSIVSVLGVKNAMMNVDFKCVNGRIVLIEFALRMGGNCLPHLVKFSSGSDQFANAVKLVMGQPVECLPCRRFAAIQYLVVRKAGVLTQLRFQNRLGQPWVKRFEALVKPGRQIHPVQLPDDRIGYIILRSRTLKEMKKAFPVVQNAISIKVKN